jgi:hypothetical protein
MHNTCTIHNVIVCWRTENLISKFTLCKTDCVLIDELTVFDDCRTEISPSRFCNDLLALAKYSMNSTVGASIVRSVISCDGYKVNRTHHTMRPSEYTHVSIRFDYSVFRLRSGGKLKLFFGFVTRNISHERHVLFSIVHLK